MSALLSVPASRFRAVRTWIRSTLTRFARAFAEHRRELARLEAELNGGRFKICSKNDDDIPIAW